MTYLKYLKWYGSFGWIRSGADVYTYGKNPETRKVRIQI